MEGSSLACGPLPCFPPSASVTGHGNRCSRSSVCLFQTRLRHQPRSQLTGTQGKETVKKDGGWRGKGAANGGDFQTCAHPSLQANSALCHPSKGPCGQERKSREPRPEREQRRSQTAGLGIGRGKGGRGREREAEGGRGRQREAGTGAWRTAPTFVDPDPQGWDHGNLELGKTQRAWDAR